MKSHQRPPAKIDVLAAEPKRKYQSTGTTNMLRVCESECHRDDYPNGMVWELCKAYSGSKGDWMVFRDFPTYGLKRKLCPQCAKGAK